MAGAIPCPVCFTTVEPAAVVAGIAICGTCGASLHVDEAGIRRATGVDTSALSKTDLQTLQRARGGIARADRRPA